MLVCIYLIYEWTVFSVADNPSRGYNIVILTNNLLRSHINCSVGSGTKYNNTSSFRFVVVEKLKYEYIQH